METLRAAITNLWVMGVWVTVMLICLAVVIYDLRSRNPELMSLMKVVWILTVLYSGPVGLAIYYGSGRKQITRDSLWRKGFRSVAHCYSGCGAGEVIGVMIAAGLLSLSNWWISGITFVLAYAMGFALTMGPLLQEGESWSQALRDAAYSESASIAVMEIVAVGVDLWLGGKAGWNDPLFWSSLIISLSMGLLAAYPVNVLLIHWGIKEGMHNPKEMAKHAHHAQHAH